MIWVLIMGTIFFTVPCSASATLSKGAITEALFIVQNKAASVRKATQELKRELTHCYSQVTSQQKDEKQAVIVPTPLATYHCKLKQLLYPQYIDELSVLLRLLEKDMLLLDEEKPLTKAEHDAIIERAFLVAEKIDIERKLFDALFHIDGLVEELLVLKESQIRRSKGGDQKRYSLEATIQKEKENCNRLKIRSKEVNKKLFLGDYKQQVFLDKLFYFRPVY